MNTIRRALVLVAVCSSSPFAGVNTEPKSGVLPAELRCEYRVNPLGIDRTAPRLSWILQASGDERGITQSAYEIHVSSSRQKLDADEGDLWNSGFIHSDRTNQISYGGKTLVSREQCYWKVRIRDRRNRLSPWSRAAFWSMGLLHGEDWSARWIGDRPIVLTGDRQQDSVARLMTPSPLFRKKFLLGRAVARATLYATALGVYELRLNGKPVGDHVLAPEWTDYRRRIQYQTYDVTGLLNTGANVVTAVLADGWFIGAVGTFADPSSNRGANYGSLDRRLLVQLEIETGDGRITRVTTDGSWAVEPDGPIRSADLYLGERVDSRKEPSGWEAAALDDSRWARATVYPAPAARLVAQMNEPVRVILKLKPSAVTEPSPGVFIADMGQNMVGRCSLRISEAEGTVVSLRHGEMLDEGGNLYTANLRSAAQTDSFIADGKQDQVFEPRFTYHGFRYVEIRGLSRKPQISSITGKVVSSDVTPAGEFACSDSSLNRLWGNILWTQLDNLIGIPTDCPQRDERLGWMADAQVFSQTAIDNYDMAAFFTKWAGDIRDAQDEEGRYPDFAPGTSVRFTNAPGWADAGIIIPWRLYQNYGDTSVLAEQFASARRFVDFVLLRNPDLIWTRAVGNSYGDWLNGNTIVAADYPKSGGEIPKPAFNTLMFGLSTRILGAIAGILHRDDDAAYYGALAQRIDEAFLRTFVKEDGRIEGDTQAGYALALGYGMLPDSLRGKALGHLLRRIADYDYRISTGFLSTIQLMNTLAVTGHADVAYRLLESHRFPSWLYQIDQGATTVWERWDGFVRGRGFQNADMNSFNHYAIGSVGEWMYGHILGIQPVNDKPGFREFIICPSVGGGLAWARGKYHSINGDIVSSWSVSGTGLTLNVEVPSNTVAEVYVPAKSVATVLEGALPARNAKGVKFVRMERGAAVFRVASGKYAFSSGY